MRGLLLAASLKIQAGVRRFLSRRCEEHCLFATARREDTKPAAVLVVPL
jgi:hypothetical protein